MEQGYSFVWPSGREPYMISSEGNKIKMEVRDLIPYVCLGAKDYRPSRKFLRLSARSRNPRGRRRRGDRRRGEIQLQQVKSSAMMMISTPSHMSHRSEETIQRMTSYRMKSPVKEKMMMVRRSGLKRILVVKHLTMKWV
eukprot:s5034_g3.t1